ncbi:restriction endonuclease subunit S [Flexivirga sp. B27]
MSRPPAGWLSKLPDRWTLTPAKALFSERREPSSRDDVHLTPSQTYGVLPQTEYMAITGGRVVLNLAGSDKMKHVEPDDFVIHLRSFQGGIEHSSARGKVSVAYTVLTPRPGVDSRYYRWLLKSDAYVQELRTTTNQLRDGQSIKYGNFAQIALPRPPDPEQRAIADFLDRETARIDTLIAKQEQLIATLRERRIGVIRASITGIDSGLSLKNTAHWFGALPAAWTAAPIRYNFSTVLGKMLNSSKPDSDAVGYIKAPYLAAGSIQPDDLLLDETRQMTFSHAELERYSLRAGDVVVVEGGAGYGRSHLIRRDLEGWGFQNHVARIRPSSGRVTSEFLTYCLKACLASGYIEANNRTATLPSLSRDVLGAIQIPMPPVKEQNRISNYLDEKTARIGALTARTERFIELSRERRSALITAAVTGQMDVRGEVA